MAERYKQETYYDLSLIEQRLSDALGSSEWLNLKKTDLGQALIKFAANVVHLDAMAFFTGLDQFFKSTVTQKGYLEEIAKSNGVIPKTYISASLSLGLYSKASIVTFLPMDLSLEVGGKKFYNIEDITVGTIANPSSVVLYEGSVVREASKVGKPTGNTWSYTKLRAVQAEKIGDRVVRRFLLLPRETFVDSILVESGIDWDIPFIRWSRVNTWYGVGPNVKAWKLGKDYLGRYVIEFGDGTFGEEYPVGEILAIRYIVAGGSGVVITNYSNRRLFSQDANDVTNSFVLGTISDFVDGSSEVNFQDLQLEIDLAQNTRDALITESDYKNYLESRYDVLWASVQAERHNNPPNIQFYNTVTYAVKPNAEGGRFNDSDIQQHLGRYGLKTVEFRNVPMLYAKFNVVVRFGVLPGVSPATVYTQINSILSEAFAWKNLGFGEVLSSERVYLLIKDISGLNLSQTEIIIEYVYCDSLDGDLGLSINTGGVLVLPFYPRRFRVRLESDLFYSGTSAKDDGTGSVYGDSVDFGKIEASEAKEVSKVSFSAGRFAVIGSTGNKLQLLDMYKDAGALSAITLAGVSSVLAACYNSRYKEIVVVHAISGDFYLSTYAFPDTFSDPDSFSFVQLRGDYVYPTYTKRKQITAIPEVVGVAAVACLDSYAYVVWNTSVGGMVSRYRIMGNTIEDVDMAYNSIGVLPLSNAEYVAATFVEKAFDGYNILCLAVAAGSRADDCSLDVVVRADIATECYFEEALYQGLLEYLGEPLEVYGMSSNGKDLYLSVVSPAYEKAVVLKMYSLESDGSGFVKELCEDSEDTLCCAIYGFHNSAGFVYTYDPDNRIVYRIGHDEQSGSLVSRYESKVSGISSIIKVASIDYEFMKMEFLVDLVDATLSYETEKDMVFSGNYIAVLNSLSITQR